MVCFQKEEKAKQNEEVFAKWVAKKMAQEAMEKKKRQKEEEEKQREKESKKRQKEEAEKVSA